MKKEGSTFPEIKKNIDTCLAKHKKFFVFLLFLLPLLCLFPTGSLCWDSKMENMASEFSKIVTNNTNNKEYLSLSIESKKDDVVKSISSEFYSTYGAFREKKLYFAATSNSNKENIISSNDLNCDNLSFLLANVFGNIEYNGHYKHEYYPLELMYRGNNSHLDDAFSFCYISQSQADYLLQVNGHQSGEYNTLIGTNISLLVKEHLYIYTIANIYLENNHFYDGLFETMGNFVVTGTKLPKELKIQYNYYMNCFTFQNQFLLNRIKSIYSADSFIVQINSFNLKTEISEIEKTKLLSFFYNNKNHDSNTLGTILLIVEAMCFSFSLVFLYRNQSIKTISRFFLFLCFAFVPSMIFWVSYIISGSTFLFSHISTLVNGILVFMYIVFGIICLIKNNSLTVGSFEMKSFYEIFNKNKK